MKIFITILSLVVLISCNQKKNNSVDKLNKQDKKHTRDLVDFVATYAGGMTFEEFTRKFNINRKFSCIDDIHFCQTFELVEKHKDSCMLSIYFEKHIAMIDSSGNFLDSDVLKDEIITGIAIICKGNEEPTISSKFERYFY